MQVSARSYLTAGIAVLGAGAIALTPVQPIAAPTALAPAAAKAVAVSLAASIDPITPIIDTIQTTFANASTLLSDYFANPLPIVQQVINNWGYYLTEFPNIGTIVQQVIGNIPRALQAPFDPGTLNDGTEIPGVANGDNISDLGITTISPVLGVTLPLSQKDIYGTLLNVLPAETVNTLKPVLNFLNTPISGTVLGVLGPIVAPFIALGNGISGAFAALQASDWATAINDLINIPTNMINAALNGGVTLDLTGLLGGAIPEVNSIGIKLGGLLSTFTSTIANPGHPVGTISVGGVGFDALAVNATIANPINPALPDITLDDPGIGIGLVGALVSGTRAIAGAINNVPTVATAAVPRRAAAAAKTAPAAKPAATARSAAAARHAK